MFFPRENFLEKVFSRTLFQKLLNYYYYYYLFFKNFWGENKREGLFLKSSSLYFIIQFFANSRQPLSRQYSIFSRMRSSVTPNFSARQAVQRKSSVMPRLISFLVAPISSGLSSLPHFMQLFCIDYLATVHSAIVRLNKIATENVFEYAKRFALPKVAYFQRFARRTV